jgi:uncharacterized membrane protein
MAGKSKIGPVKGPKKDVKKMPEEKMKAAPAASTASPKAAPKSSDDNKLIAALAYVIQFWVPLYILLTEKKNDPVLRFHAWQSLLFTAGWVIGVIGLSVIAGMLAFVTGPLVACVGPLYFLPLLYALFVAYKVYNGEKYIIPMLGEQAEKMASK